MDLFDVVNELQRAVTRANAMIYRLQWANDHSFVCGPVTDVDPKKHRCRIAVGEDADGKEVKSPWIPYGQIAGTRKVHSAPSKGQQMTLFSPNGDYTQAVAVPYTWSDNNPSPSDKGDEDIDLRGRTKRTQKDADLKQEVDGLTVHHTKQSTVLTVHKDGQNEEVSDKKPWKGNRAGAKHKRIINKDSGYALTINDGEQNNEHKITAHPEGKIENSVFNEKNKTTIDRNKIRHSVDNEAHFIDVKDSEGIELKTSKRISQEAASDIVDTAPMIHHHGLTDVFGTLNIGGNMDWLHDLAQTIMGGAMPGLGQGSQPGAAGGNLNVSGIANVIGGLNVDGLTSLGNGLNVSGAVNFASNLSISGESNFGGPFSVDGAANLHSGANITGDTSLNGDFSVSGTTSIATLHVSGIATFDDDLTVDGAALFTSVNSTGPVSFGQTLTVTGLTTLNGGLDAGALDVAKVADGGLTHAAMGLKVTGQIIVSLQNYANDSDAAAGGIAVGQLYRNGSVVMVRVV